MAREIEYKRGVIKRRLPNGLDVYMYRDTPGVFLNAFGKEVSESLAEKAGFDVKHYAGERRYREEMQKAEQSIRKQVYADRTAEEVIEERNGYKLVRVSKDRYQVRDDQDRGLTATPLPEDEANGLLDDLAGPAPEKPEADEPEELTEADVKAEDEAKAEASEPVKLSLGKSKQKETSNGGSSS